MKLIFHGGAMQIGRSCIEANTDKTRILLDAGLWITPGETQFPEVQDIQSVDALIISHAHLDHTGAIPLFEHQGLRSEIFCTKATEEITRVLLKDSFKVSLIRHQHIDYNQLDIKKALRFFRQVGYHEARRVKDISFTFYPAGHIPGSSMVLLDHEGKKTLYTGDFNFSDTMLLNGSHKDFGEIDNLIIETTYGDRPHPNRAHEEERFLRAVEEGLARGGKVLIPAFAVGRAQEVLLILGRRNLDVPIYLDGMARQIAETIVDNPEEVKDIGLLRKVIDACHFVKDTRHREDILYERCVIVTTSGMVNGGPATFYLEKLYNDPKNSILLTGFQSKGTNGRHLKNDNSFYFHGNFTEVKASVESFDLSAHSGQDELRHFIRKLNPKKVILQHGDEKALLDMKEWCDKESYYAEIAEIGKEITV